MSNTVHTSPEDGMNLKNMNHQAVVLSHMSVRHTRQFLRLRKLQRVLQRVQFALRSVDAGLEKRANKELDRSLDDARWASDFLQAGDHLFDEAQERLVSTSQG